MKIHRHPHFKLWWTIRIFEKHESLDKDRIANDRISNFFVMPVEAIAVTLIGYLLGSIPFGVLVARKYGIDIYKVGSGNPGATNILREIGKPAGYLVFFLDFLKGLVATIWFLLPIFSFSGDLTLSLWGLPAAVLGHTFPLFAKFRGEGCCHRNGRITWSYAGMPDYRLGLLGNLFQHPLCSSCLYWFWSKSASMLYSKFLV